MTRLVAVPIAALLALSACDTSPGSECKAGTERCSGNVLQKCYSDEMFGKAYWHDYQSCPPSMVCRLDAAPPGADPGTPLATGCFAPNAYCEEGVTQCGTIGMSSDPVLWSCALQPDQVIEWVKTDCSARSPAALCVVDGTPSVAACYPVVRNCSASDVHCEGNVLFSCNTIPAIVDGQAVFDWSTMDCTAFGQVCRIVPQVGPTCASP